MEDKEISELNSASLPLAGTEIVPIVQGGVTKKVAVSEIGNDTPFDPSNYDLDEFTNASEDPFVRQSEVTTPDLDAVTQEGNVTKTEIIFAEESEEETTNLIAIGGVGGGDAYLSLRNLLGSNPSAKLLLYLNPLTDSELFLPDLGGNLYSTIIVTSNITAKSLYDYFNASNTNTYTDPGTGNFYFVFVSSGIAIVGGVSYGVGTYLLRYYNGTTWFTKVLNATASPTVEGTTKLYDSLGTGTDGAVNRTVVTEEFAKSQKTLIQKTLGSVTGTTTETIISTLEILGGTFPSTTYFEWVAPLRKPNSSTPSFKLYLNTTPDLSGSPVQLALYTSASANRTMPFSRWFEVRGGNLIGSSSGTNQMLTTLGVLANQEGISTSYNVANTYYFIVTVANSDTSMTSECPFQKITLI
jgi:hypothetical protein